MKRIAAPMVGGLISSAILTWIIIPAAYMIWKQWQFKIKESHFQSLLLLMFHP